MKMSFLVEFKSISHQSIYCFWTASLNTKLKQHDGRDIKSASVYNDVDERDGRLSHSHSPSLSVCLYLSHSLYLSLSIYLYIYLSISLSFRL